MVKVKVIQDYYDREQDKDMTVGNTFECSDERANTLIAFGVAKKLEESSPATNETNTEVKSTTGGWFR